MKGNRRIVITGMGMVSALGLTVQESWDNLVDGVSGVRAVTEFDTSEYDAHIWAKVPDKFDPEKFLSDKQVKRSDPFCHLGMAAADEALTQAGLYYLLEHTSPDRIGVFIGSGVGGLKTFCDGYTDLRERGPKRLAPMCIPAGIINGLASLISIKYGFTGPSLAVVSACAAGTHNIGMAARAIMYGDADVMIAGGAESLSIDLYLAGFGVSRALAKDTHSPEQSSRPFDKDRTGFVLGEGAGVVVLEEYEHAKKRGANILAEIIGFGMSSDAFHMTHPDLEASGPTRCIISALEDIGDIYEIEYISAHGTGTKINDINETIAIKRAMGNYAYDVAISAPKSMTGHALGAAGAIETIFSVMSLKYQVAPPTINLDTPDPECDLDYVPNTARDMKIETVLNNSFGFGGTNAALVLKRI